MQTAVNRSRNTLIGLQCQGVGLRQTKGKFKR